MNDPIDTGFDDVLAGEVWDPSPAPVTVTVIGADALSELPPPAPAALPSTGLTAAGVQAAKALVHLPPLSYPDLARLAREIAMDIKEKSAILAEFKLNDTQYDFLETNNEFYRQALAAACTDWHAPLSTTDRIKVEAAAILEDSLLGLGARMQNKGEGLPGVIEAAKLFAKVAGVGERDAFQAAPGERFTINIDLGGDQKISVTSEVPAGTNVIGPPVRALQP